MEQQVHVHVPPVGAPEGLARRFAADPWRWLPSAWPAGRTVLATGGVRTLARFGIGPVAGRGQTASRTVVMEPLDAGEGAPLFVGMLELHTRRYDTMLTLRARFSHPRGGPANAEVAYAVAAQWLRQVSRSLSAAVASERASAQRAHPSNGAPLRLLESASG